MSMMPVPKEAFTRAGVPQVCGFEFLYNPADARYGVCVRTDGTLPPIAYVHGELFGANGLKIIPDNPRGSRSKSLELRCKGKGQWNVYDVVFVDGVVKLSVNGKFVNGVSKSSIKKGYLCLESEGAEIHFRNIQIMELPPGVTVTEQIAPIAKD